ncbi:MAG: IPT/TIG domain-containing protein, partial [Chloroflexota bacterium]
MRFIKRVRVAKRLLHILVILGLLGSDLGISPPQIAHASTPDTISYVYDGLGRVAAATDPASDTAIYRYDPLGNLLSLARQSSSLVSVLQFTPGAAPVGASVTIYGTGFSATPSQNTIAFNGTTATVTSATPTQLVVTVPTGATSGPIAVTSRAGSATSSGSFTIGNPRAPSIASFSPTVGTVGTAITLTGANFDPSIANDRIVFNTSQVAASAASSTSLGTTAPPGSSGRITVTTPDGTGVSTSDFFLAPAPYTAANVVATGRMAIGDTNQAVNVGTTGGIGLMLFDGTAGQRVSLNITNVTLPGQCCGYSAGTVSILSPAGASIAGTSVNGGSNAFIDATTLPATGTYTILLAPSSGLTGGVSLSLFNVVDIDGGSINADGSSHTVTTTTPGQNARYRFAGTAGQNVSLLLTNVTLPQQCCGYVAGNVSIIAPDGKTTVASTSVNGGNNAFIDQTALSSAGTYTILIDPLGPFTGAVTLQLYTVVDVTGTISADASAHSFTITTPGQNVRYSFAGTAGESISAE